MNIIPDYIGVSAFGIKMGVIAPGSDVVKMTYEALAKLQQDQLLHDGDTICITESVVARAQNNYVTVPDIAAQIRQKLNVAADSSLGVLFPILSRNRFSLILKGIAASVPQGRLLIQLSYPADEVGNQLLPLEFIEAMEIGEGGLIKADEILPNRFRHPVTNVDYIELYESITMEQGPSCEIVLCNDPLYLSKQDLHGVVVANVHNRKRVRGKLEAMGINCITLQDICSKGENAWSEWGLLGSNLSSGDKLKLAPRDSDKIADEVQARVKEGLGRDIEVIIYGDGAYRDPSTGIYELADPQPVFGMTSGLKGRYRVGLKYKYLVDKMLDEGVKLKDIDREINNCKDKKLDRNSIETEGTTPRKVEDLIASLADLVSGSSDAGTPLVLVKGFLS